MSGRFVISLDLELMWGVRDHRSISEYGDAVLGGRRAIPQVLKLFDEFGVRATWAAVGLLFAKNRAELQEFLPPLEPEYFNRHLSPYGFVKDGLGRDESEDPFHFGSSLIDLIRDTEGQEIATHTFSHFYCLEPGATTEAFESDLKSARGIADSHGIELKSLVFPRNQMAECHIQAAARSGLKVVRSNPTHFAYRARPRDREGAAVRAFKIVDAAIPLAGRMDYPAAVTRDATIDVPASRFLRPVYGRFPAYSTLHLRRVKGEMSAAARSGGIYHLWWHPHNMGRHTAQSLAQLQSLLVHFRRLQDEFGFRSACMADFATA